MSARPPAVVVDGVSKTFALPQERVHTLKERALHPFRRTRTDTLHALKDVSVSVEPGEFFGIVGRNGSGKSTLLKCLAGIYATDAGAIYLDGRLSAFIELGVGFSMDLPARDNIVINATMLGLSPREARRRVETVIDFAELGEFVDLKLKNYSSGMLVRLAFAVMIQVDADILLIDEVLAVGDAAFQQKCFDEFARIREAGRTVLLVTHDMTAVHRFCDRAMLLERGDVVAMGDPDEIGNR
ncbi:MAG TPA: ABC transporter ATP-binding protein, partial [Solirubrobacter sp.]|nr:ABC transporter ATP-binding protein [Solirubrobacter sp.]